MPKLKEVLARVLPVLASVKQENMKWVFASSVGHFCDAILYFAANTERGADVIPSFSNAVFPAYEIMFNNWLLSKEPKVFFLSIHTLTYSDRCDWQQYKHWAASARYSREIN